MKELKSAVSFVAAIYITFIGFLVMSSTVSGAVSDILYYSAFAIPILLGIFAIRFKKTADAPEALPADKSAEFAIPLVFPTIALVSLVAFLTSLILNLMGYKNDASFTEPCFIYLLMHAAVPAILEEILFRYVPVKLLTKSGGSPLYAVLISSLGFALAHANLFKAPYAAIAGASFAVIFLVTGSIIPSLIAHFLNNTISLITIYYDFDLWVYISLGVLAALSVIFIFLKRKDYISRIKSLFSEKHEFVMSPAAWVFTILCILLMLLTLNTK